MKKKNLSLMMGLKFLTHWFFSVVHLFSQMLFWKALVWKAEKKQI